MSESGSVVPAGKTRGTAGPLEGLDPGSAVRATVGIRSPSEPDPSGRPPSGGDRRPVRHRRRARVAALAPVGPSTGVTPRRASVGQTTSAPGSHASASARAHTHPQVIPPPVRLLDKWPPLGAPEACDVHRRWASGTMRQPTPGHSRLPMLDDRGGPRSDRPANRPWATRRPGFLVAEEHLEGSGRRSGAHRLHSASGQGADAARRASRCWSGCSSACRRRGLPRRSSSPPPRPARTIRSRTWRRQAGVACVRGHPTDLLDRHIAALHTTDCDAVSKIPSDQPSSTRRWSIGSSERSSRIPRTTTSPTSIRARGRTGTTWR
jgi:hypothetical protein